MRSDSMKIRTKASWCIAKMAQNKIPDREIIDALNDHVSDPVTEVRENVAWGIGEIAGIGIFDDMCIRTVTILMGDDEPNVRGMAAWACGRIVDRTGYKDEKMMSALESIENDESEYVRECVKFAKERITSSSRP